MEALIKKLHLNTTTIESLNVSIAKAQKTNDSCVHDNHINAILNPISYIIMITALILMILPILTKNLTYGKAIKKQLKKGGHSDEVMEFLLEEKARVQDGWGQRMVGWKGVEEIEESFYARRRPREMDVFGGGDIGERDMGGKEVRGVEVV